MKKCVVFTILLVALNAYSQDIPKKANTILIKGVSFKDVETVLLDKGYSFEKVDSNLQTLKTDNKEGSGKTKGLKFHYYVRVKDSTASVRGEWFNPSVIGTTFLGVQSNVENSTFKIENTGAAKKCFDEMNQLALSFKKPVEYLIQ